MGSAIPAKFDKIMDGETRFHRFRYHMAKGFVTSEDVVLDLGCGTGYGSSIMSDGCIEVKGFDMDKDNIDCANKQNSQFNTVYEVANLEEMEIPEADVAVSFEVIEHLYDPKAFVDRLKKKIKKFIVVSVPLDQKLIMVDGDPQEENDSTHHSVFTQTDFTEMFEDDTWRVFEAWRSGVTFIAIFYRYE